MKFLIHRLQRGQIVVGEIVEVISPKEIIVDFRGDLIRVGNHSGRPMTKGQRLKLKVTSTSPLSFQLDHGDRSRLDRSV